jgi:ribonuclease-3
MPKHEVHAFAEKIGVSFNEIELLKQALTHRSYVNEHRKGTNGHNERLEFLGDAVLELMITHYLFNLFPDKTEGDLTSYRAALVNTQALSVVATQIELNDFLLLSRGESKDIGRARENILANAVEAVIGAIYLDQGFEAAKDFVVKFIAPKITTVLSQGSWIDAKSKFQERAQEKKSITPIYKVIKEAGPDHDKHFVVGVYLGEELLAQGEGKSKQEAEQEAAKGALEKQGWN